MDADSRLNKITRGGSATGYVRVIRRPQGEFIVKAGTLYYLRVLRPFSEKLLLKISTKILAKL